MDSGLKVVGNTQNLSLDANTHIYIRPERPAVRPPDAFVPINEIIYRYVVRPRHALARIPLSGTREPFAVVHHSRLCRRQRRYTVPCPRRCRRCRRPPDDANASVLAAPSASAPGETQCRSTGGAGCAILPSSPRGRCSRLWPQGSTGQSGHWRWNRGPPARSMFHRA